MNAAASCVLRDLTDICAAYGQSDEFSFVLPPACELFNRREAKILSTICSVFTGAYVGLWAAFFSEPLASGAWPSFDARAVEYPTERLLRDYLSWRQADCELRLHSSSIG